MVWVTFRGMRSHVFKQSYAMAAESQKVPLEIFFNPTILSGDNLFWSASIFSHLPFRKVGTTRNRGGLGGFDSEFLLTTVERFNIKKRS
jgi:hypothetical protein